MLSSYPDSASVKPHSVYGTPNRGLGVDCRWFLRQGSPGRTQRCIPARCEYDETIRNLHFLLEVSAFFEISPRFGVRGEIEPDPNCASIIVK